MSSRVVQLMRLNNAGSDNRTGKLLITTMSGRNDITLYLRETGCGD
jgi:hypothetical protein